MEDDDDAMCERVSQRQTKARHSGQFRKLKREQRLACGAVLQCSAASVSSSSFESEARHSIQICCPAAGLRSWQVRLILQGDLMEFHLKKWQFFPSRGDDNRVSSRGSASES